VIDTPRDAVLSYRALAEDFRKAAEQARSDIDPNLETGRVWPR
jgi:hypothetical protein